METEEIIKDINRRMVIELIRGAMLDYARTIITNSSSDTMDIAIVTADKVIKELEWKP